MWNLAVQQVQTTTLFADNIQSLFYLTNIGCHFQSNRLSYQRSPLSPPPTRALGSEKQCLSHKIRTPYNTSGDATKSVTMKLPSHFWALRLVLRHRMPHTVCRHWCRHQLINSKEEDLHWEINNTSASEETPGHLWDPTVHYHVHKSSPLLVPYTQSYPRIVTLSPSKTKRRLLYLKTQSVPRCKHFSSRL